MEHGNPLRETGPKQHRSQVVRRALDIITHAIVVVVTAVHSVQCIIHDNERGSLIEHASNAELNPCDS